MGRLVLGVEHVVDDGESGSRVRAAWKSHDHVAVGMSARWWGGYQAFEPEIQWFPLTSTVVPFVSTSAVFEEHTDVQGYGWSVWAGAYMPVSLISDRLSWTAGVGWRSLYVEERSDNHWLRIRAGVLMHL
jgi:hypothetical protein